MDKYTVLNKVSNPADIKKLNAAELNTLAAEVRSYMTDVVSKNGGHLASSLGSVDVTIALLKCFDLPEDKIIWDVGHQAYGFKILTGRKHAFKTLRQYGGISGFLKRDESKYDAFGAGHTSTSISAAMGFAKARDINKKNNYITAVIGDASVANGMALEAMNHIGSEKTDMLIVIIDNEMSISPTVGALSTHLNKIISGKFYNELRASAKNVIEKIPKIGVPASHVIKHLEEGVKSIFSRGIIFEDLGFMCYGPIDGHDIELLCFAINNMKMIKGPKILHVITKKGKGYEPAEKSPTLFHGIGSFDRETGVPVKSKSASPSYSSVFSEKLVKLASANKKIIAIVAAMIEGTNLTKFKEKFPERFFDVGIAEEHAVTFASGLAAAGFKPVVAVYSTFMQRAYDQIIHDAAMQKLPVIFALDRAGIVGEDGPTHHGAFDIAFMRTVPGMVVMAPSDAAELEKLMQTAAEYNGGPVSIRFPRGESWVLQSKEKKPVKIGQARIIKTGKSLTIVCLGSPLLEVIKAVKAVEKKSRVKIEIIDARFAKPIDVNTIKTSVKKTGKLITIEEGAIEGGFGQALITGLHQAGLDKFESSVMAMPDHFAGQGKMTQVKHDCGLDSAAIEKQIIKMVIKSK
ncbi:MAG TPA: 1-deoxy-D-xylulose-5-phosphate synthase [Candidatus Goldiibacteriota bacterium]|nr:1-deoxy-D-xylulose-5-phosphate synthase [Candidatus Goldiibacteriota bacterium]HRQ44238.1 1-deoxy-D-xylulose-5-phosphate synthase [Candidatus Goldiibacteriota bacterium]